MKVIGEENGKVLIRATPTERYVHEQAVARIEQALAEAGLRKVFICDGWPGFPFRVQAQDGPSIVNFGGSTARVVCTQILARQAKKQEAR